MFNEQLKIGLHMLLDGTRPSVCFCDTTAPSPNLFALVSKRNGLLKSVKASTGTSRAGFLESTKGILMHFPVSVTHSFFLLAPSPERCLCRGCTM